LIGLPFFFSPTVIARESTSTGLADTAGFHRFDLLEEDGKQLLSCLGPPQLQLNWKRQG